MTHVRIVAMAGLLALLPGCAALYPDQVSTEQRLDAFRAATSGEAAPDLQEPVEIFWSDNQIPYIVADSDRDLAYSLGLVHQHLRGGQLAVLKRISQGRISEMAGPFTRDIDHALRILDYGLAAPEVVAAWPPETRTWMQAFVDGMNHYQANVRKQPPEYGLLGISPEPWKMEDLVTIGRLAGTDVTWLAYVSLLPLRNQPGWEETWRRALEAGGVPPGVISENLSTEEATLRVASFLAGLSKSGSNSLVVAPERSATGGALIANDPHLGLNLPNLWLLAGVKSPSYHAVGMMVPGLPFVALGRNEALAWGGTNLRAASSNLYDVSNQAEETFEVEEVRIGTRLWFDDKRTIRRSSLGPIISDAPMISGRPGEVLALRWVGHEPTDEIGAFLEANRATTPEAFRVAYRSYGVSAQNMLFAGTDGQIGKVLALQAPARQPGPPLDLVLEADDPAAAWGPFDNSLDLPFVLNPDTGFLVSGNNRPRQTDRLLGYFFTPDDRVARMASIIEATPRLTVEDLKRLQQDVTSPESRALAMGLVRLARAADAQPASFLERVAAWDGDYGVQSSGAPAFELLLTAVVKGLYGDEEGKVAGAQEQWGYLQTFLLPDLEALPAADRKRLMDKAVAEASDAVGQFATWGELHRLRIGHVLSQAPVIGSRFVVDRVPIGGSRETLSKTAHGLIEGPHDARYGAQSRHISDLADRNANWFVLLGGQDGWLGSANYADQVPLWLNGDYLRVPLDVERARADFPHHIKLGS
ncbi:MAG: penicillin acylase family protein [Rhodospirillales bacterium]